jgi:hypothetical protein
MDPQGREFVHARKNERADLIYENKNGTKIRFRLTAGSGALRQNEREDKKEARMLRASSNTIEAVSKKKRPKKPRS